MKIRYSEYEKANSIKHSYWYYNNYGNKISEEEFNKAQEICNKFKKQNRFNPFLSLEHDYKDHIRYGKKIKFFKKSFLVLLCVFRFIITSKMFDLFNTEIFVCTIITFLPLFIFSLIMTQVLEVKYYYAKLEYEANMKYNKKQYIREQKLKRLIK